MVFWKHLSITRWSLVSSGRIALYPYHLFTWNIDVKIGEVYSPAISHSVTMSTSRAVTSAYSPHHRTGDSIAATIILCRPDQNKDKANALNYLTGSALNQTPNRSRVQEIQNICYFTIFTLLTAIQLVCK